MAKMSTSVCFFNLHSDIYNLKVLGSTQKKKEQ